MATFVHWLPPLLIGIIAITFIISYFVAVSLNHVYPFWPYISETGTLPPESCIFSFLLNIGSTIMVLIIFVRHLQVLEFINMKPYIKITRQWNMVSSIIGFIGVLGLGLLSNFQESNQFLVHIIGALMCFVISTIYFFIQCIFTHKMKFVSQTIFWLRVIFTGINVVTFAMVFAPIKAAGDNFKGKNVLMWSPKDGGHEFHLISTISEWILVLSFALYISTFYWEFKKFELTSPQVKFYFDAPYNSNKYSEEQTTSTASAWI